ncbi:DUF2252 domain-containing protein [Edaphobacter bradus]|uniref:DUF2252 domain-containing protein n=1 Tax=Edaphobacter bradus TaxID=2259016 RepID=UPI0021E08ADF|nr:DUF2252 domain-containing protein [Edaphobacter bradus]
MSMSPEPQERRALGQKRRKQIRRLEHGGWDGKKRKESPLKLMEASMRERVPSLVALKYERMAASPFGYFRGAVPVMAYDLSLVGNTGIVCQLCGDAHVRNLGAYAAQDGRLVFDINDFDETIAGPFEWDVKRMAASLVLAGREAGSKNVHCRDAAMVFAERYRMSMLEFAQLPVIEMARYQVHRLRDIATLEGILRLAERAIPMHTLMSLTEVRGQENAAVAGKKKQAAKELKTVTKNSAAEKESAKAAAKTTTQDRVFKTSPPVLTRLTGAMADKVLAALKSYEVNLQPERRRLLAQYRPVDVSFKVVGTGSVGLRDYCVYLQGNGANDPLFLQIKQEVSSAYAPYVGKLHGAWKESSHQGRRVVEGERAMQVQSDPFLGWTTLDGRDYLVRQLNDHKASIQVEDLRATSLMEYAEVCGELLARGHARSGDCQQLAGYLGKAPRFDEGVVRFGEVYADQTEADWKQLVGWLKRSNKRAGKRSGKAVPAGKK